MNLTAKKSLGQHFLNSKSVLEKIIATASIKPDETVLEIGPGTGILTEALLQAEAKVIAIEKDHRACDLLKEKFSKEILEGKLNLIEGDILEDTSSILSPSSKLLPLSSYLLAPSSDLQPLTSPPSFSLVANIPYYITGAILEKFLEKGPRPAKMVLLVQKEVSERICANRTGDSKESVLSISVKAFGTPRLIAKVPPGAFTPPPTVDSAILAVDNISDRHFSESGVKTAEFFRLVKAGFAHKRKYLQRNLEILLPQEKLSKIWLELNLNPQIRPEDLTLESWLEISKKI